MENKSNTDDEMQNGTYSATLLIRARKIKNSVKKDEI